MTRRARFAILLALCLPAAAQDEGEEGIVPLFDGTLEGWEGDPRFWRVEDGAIVGESTAENPCDTTTYLTWTGGRVADFDLRLSFRIVGGNSGVQFRSRRAGGYDVAGYQADLEDGRNWTGCLYEQGGRGVLVRRGQRVVATEDGEVTTEQVGSDADLLALLRKHEWNEYRVRAVGERVEIFLNGERTVELIDDDPRFASRSGVLALQLHAGPPMRIEVRDLRLLDLGGEGEPDEPAKPEPEWIWISRLPADGETMYTRGTLEIGRHFERAMLWGSCDNACEVFLNGERVARSTDWTVPFAVNLTSKVRPGTNTLAAWGRNEGGPAAMWLELVVVYDDHEEALVTDASWLVTGAPTDGWKAGGSRDGWIPAQSFGELGVGPWGLPTEVSDGQGERALPAEALELADGFAAELLHSVPKAEQGSWVSLTFDPEGRLLASDQYGALYRATPPPIGSATGTLDVERLDLDLGRAHGLCCAFGALYVVVAEGEGKGLYRARDTDGDDRYDEVELLKPLRGGGEHGPHAVVPGPDGRSLWIVGGNHTAVPDGVTRSRPTQVWEEDQLLPRRPDPNGHAVGVMAPGGWVVRTDPDGEEWELVAIGMRNAYDIDFDPSGELFTFDSDMEWDVGLPWYRPTRVLHLVSGADFGWRHGSGKWPAHYPDSLPSVADLGLSSPTGVVFGTRAAFHAPYREAFLVSDWAYGTIWAVHMAESGGSFTGRGEVFVRGRPFPVTDLAVGPDGALYVTTGGRRTQSGVYRIHSERDPAPEPVAARPGPARAARRVIERNHGTGVPSPYWSELGSTDRFLAHAARTALEQTAPEHWAERALAEDDARIALQALLALVRVYPEEYGGRIRERLESLEVAAAPNDLLLPYLRLLGLVWIRAGAPSADEAARWAAALTPRLPSGERDLDRELLRVLVAAEAPGAARLGVEGLEAAERAEDPEQQIYQAFTLRTLEHGWTLSLRRRYFRWLNEVGPTLSGGHSLARYVDGIREDALAHLPDELRAWPDLLAPPPAPPEGTADAEPVEAATFVRAWTADDLVPWLAEVGHGRDRERGRRAYLKATCAECHRFDGSGGSTGPDLTGAGSRFNARDLLQTMLAPSETISDQYQDTEIRMEDGRVLVGRVMLEEGSLLVVRVWSPSEEDVEVDLADVELRRPHPLSRMPSGLLDVLEREEILDLLAYVLGG